MWEKRVYAPRIPHPGWMTLTSWELYVYKKDTRWMGDISRDEPTKPIWPPLNVSRPFVHVDLHINSCGTTKPAKAEPAPRAICSVLAVKTKIMFPPKYMKALTWDFLSCLWRFGIMAMISKDSCTVQCWIDMFKWKCMVIGHWRPKW